MQMLKKKIDLYRKLYKKEMEQDSEMIEKVLGKRKSSRPSIVEGTSP